MVTQCSYIWGEGTNPHRNLALEAVLLEAVPESSCILYLWQNQKTVVIGKNQNAWKECRVKELEEDGGFLARRLSGGGAVFHDLGNLNFTFLVNTEDYDLEKQLDVILKSVQMLGLQAEKTGRNDITIEGKKFSGNAFYHHGGKSYHHGTLMLDVNKELVAKYLNVSQEKLSAKGVDSVRSRVGNLVEFCPSVTVEQMGKNLLEAFTQVYGTVPKEIKKETLDSKRQEELFKKFSSWEWRLGRKLAFGWETEKRFPWGSIELQLKMDEGKVCDAAVYSDAMDGDFVAEIAPCFLGKPFSSAALSQAFKALSQENRTQLQKQMIADIEKLLAEQNF